MDEIVFPDGTKLKVKALRFLNILDDAHNMVSWTKVNLVGSVFAAHLTGFGIAWAWLTGHTQMLQHALDAAAPVGTWISHAFTAHHFDKKERNRVKIAMAQTVRAPDSQKG